MADEAKSQLGESSPVNPIDDPQSREIEGVVLWTAFGGLLFDLTGKDGNRARRFMTWETIEALGKALIAIEQEYYDAASPNQVGSIP
jgi:hypothetical protein